MIRARIEAEKAKKEEMLKFFKDIADLCIPLKLDVAVAWDYHEIADEIVLSNKDKYSTVIFVNNLRESETWIGVRESLLGIPSWKCTIMSFREFNVSSLVLNDQEFLELAEKVESKLLGLSFIVRNSEVIISKFWKCPHCATVTDKESCPNCGKFRS